MLFRSIYLAALGLCFGMQHLHCVTRDLFLWLTDSPVAAHRLLSCGTLAPAQSWQTSLVVAPKLSGCGA